MFLKTILFKWRRLNTRCDAVKTNLMGETDAKIPLYVENNQHWIYGRGQATVTCQNMSCQTATCRVKTMSAVKRRYVKQHSVYI